MLAFAPDLSIYFKNSKIERLVSYNLNFEWHGSLLQDLLHVCVLFYVLVFAPDLTIYFKNSSTEDIVLFYTIYIFNSILVLSQTFHMYLSFS